MPFIRHIGIVISSLYLVCLLGCASYSARPLDRITSTIVNRETEQSILFSHKVFNKSDCKKYLDRNVIAEGYQPIQITLINNTKKRLYISKESFSFPCIDPQEVAYKVHTNTTKRAVSYGIGGLFIPILFIPAIVDGVGSSRANEQLDRDFIAKTISNQVVSPYGIINSLIFVPVSCFNHDFTLVVKDFDSDAQFILSTKEPAVHFC
ncbi:MAG: hypothetical protein WD068_01965 [Candidatus Babeliales bacterium]